MEGSHVKCVSLLQEHLQQQLRQNLQQSETSQQSDRIDLGRNWLVCTNKYTSTIHTISKLVCQCQNGLLQSQVP